MIVPFWERAEFPHHLVPKLATLGMGGGTLSGNGCPGMSVVACAMVRCLSMFHWRHRDCIEGQPCVCMHMSACRHLRMRSAAASA